MKSMDAGQKKEKELRLNDHCNSLPGKTASAFSIKVYRNEKTIKPGMMLTSP
jgi:hypothetical protein